MLHDDSTKLVYDCLKYKYPVVICKKMRTEGEMLVVNNAEYSTEIVNQVAKDFLLKCDGKHTFQEILLLLGEEYGRNEEQLIQDFVSFVRMLQWKRMISLID